MNVRRLRSIGVAYDADVADVVAVLDDDAVVASAGVSDVNSDDDGNNVDDNVVVGVDCVIINSNVDSEVNGAGCDR